MGKPGAMRRAGGDGGERQLGALGQGRAWPDHEDAAAAPAAQADQGAGLRRPPREARRGGRPERHAVSRRQGLPVISEGEGTVRTAEQHKRAPKQPAILT